MPIVTFTPVMGKVPVALTVIETGPPPIAMLDGFTEPLTAGRVSDAWVVEPVADTVVVKPALSLTVMFDVNVYAVPLTFGGALYDAL